MRRPLNPVAVASIATAALGLLYAIGMLVPELREMLVFLTSMFLILFAIAGLHVGEAKGGFVVPTAGSYLFLICVVWALSFLLACILMRRAKSAADSES